MWISIQKLQYSGSVQICFAQLDLCNDLLQWTSSIQNGIASQRIYQNCLQLWNWHWLTFTFSMWHGNTDLPFRRNWTHIIWADRCSPFTKVLGDGEGSDNTLYVPTNDITHQWCDMSVYGLAWLAALKVIWDFTIWPHCSGPSGKMTRESMHSIALVWISPSGMEKRLSSLLFRTKASPNRRRDRKPWLIVTSMQY